jgi:dipeptidyl aminopeptidase/acylaminoacyl peptidase
MSRSTQPPANGGRRFRRRLLAVSLILLFAYLGAGAIIASDLTLPKRQFYAEAAATLGLSYQDVRFPARGDGLQIAGWYVPSAGSTRAIIVVHGKDQSRATEFFDKFPNGRLTEMSAGLQAAGFAVLMIDLRGHGQSGDARFSFGLRERQDVMGAADWLKTQGFRPGSIGALGVSLGAASAVGAAAEDSDIGAVVVDSGFAEWCPVMYANWTSATGLPDALIPPARLMTRLLYGYDVCDARPVTEIGRIAPRPVLLIHTVRDQLIAASHVDQMKAALPSAELWMASGLEHARNYNADPAEYLRRVTEFFDRGLTK